MTIHVSLSTESINSAIESLVDIAETINEGMEDFVQIMTTEAAEVAQSAYGGFGVAAVPSVDGTHGYIDVVGDMPLIAEFGAGDTVINPGSLFEGSPYTPVYPGSYSIEEGTREYATFGSWHFGGAKYTQVSPHLGLFSAKQYIIENSTELALEVMHF